MKDIKIPYDFNWEFYLNNYKDLLDAGLKTEEDAINHWINFGYNENRKYKPKIGIAISTWADENTKDIRLEIIKKSLDSYKNVNIPIILVNDGSTNKKHIELINSYEYIKVINNPINGNVAMAKNIAIKYFDENDFDFCLMMDDDMEIIDDKFYQYYYDAYKKSGIHHLCYQVNHPNAYIEKVNDFSLSKSDHTNGCLYTITKEMIKELGYLKILKYKYGHAHSGYTLRSIKFGYAPGFFDIIDSSKYLKLIPESNENSSVIDKCDKKMRENWEEVSLYHNTKYIPFEDEYYSNCNISKNNIICSILLNKNIDPQRGIQINDTHNYIREWYDSILSLNLNAIIFHDNLDDDFIKKYSNKNISFIKIEQKALNTVDYRWIIYSEFLKVNKYKYDNILFTDISDVIFLKNPFEFLEKKKNTIFIGSQESILGPNTWLSDRNRYFYNIIPDFKEYETTYYYTQSKNCGIIGGDVNIVSEFIDDMSKLLLMGNVDNDTVDMSVTNYLIHTKYKDKHIFGYPLNTKFKSYEFDTNCYIKHK